MSENLQETTQTPSKVITKAIKKSSRGINFMILIDSDGTYGVYQHCANYNGRVKGGISYTWRYIKKRLPYAEALELFNNRTK